MDDFETHPAGTADLVEQLRGADKPLLAQAIPYRDVRGLIRQAADRIEQLEAALTRANAAAAAAYELAARAIMEKCHDDMDRKKEAAIVRALATPDQTAALDKLIAEAEARVRDALEGPLWRLILRDEGCIDSPCDDAECECRMKLERILAASKKGGA